MNELTDFIYLYMSEHLPIPTPTFHFELHELIPNKRVAVAAPRSFAKSFTYSFFYPLFAALTRENQNILLISATATLAESWLRRIKIELEENDKLLTMYGTQKSSKWTESWICLANGNQIRAAGAGCQIRGFRYTIIICDDLDTDEGVRNEDQREKLNSWFWASLVNTLEPTNQLIIIGTILHPFSFLSELMKGKEGWITRKYKAIQDDNSLLWKQKWSREALDVRKQEIGSIAFASEFLNTPILEGMSYFRAEDILTHDDDIPFGTDYITVDLAISEKESADFTVVMVARRTQNNSIYVRDYVKKRMNPRETIDTILKVAKDYDPVCIGIESVAYQKALIYMLEEEMRRTDRFWRVEEIKPDRDKQRRIGMLVPYFENHRIFVHKDMKDLIEELTCFPAVKHDDLSDALAMQLVISRMYGATEAVEELDLYNGEAVSGY